MKESFIGRAKKEWQSYRDISMANKYIKRAHKVLHEDRELSIAYRDLAQLYEKRSKKNRTY